LRVLAFNAVGAAAVQRLGAALAQAKNSGIVS
jgi:hypothetical protein